MKTKNFKFKSMALVLFALVLSSNVWGADVTLAEWTFSSGTAGTNYPSNKTNFGATNGTCKSGSTFYLNGSGSTWNTSKGYAFTAVTDIQITVKATEAISAGTKITFNVTTYYNKDKNAPMKGFSLMCKEGSGSFATTGLSTTSWSLSTSSATKTVVYTTQNEIAKDGTIVLNLTQTEKAGAGEGYMGPITVTMPAAASYTVTKTLNNCSVTGTAIPATTTTGFSTTISANSGYQLPSTITVTGASHTWNASTGALTISNVTGNVSITITATAAKTISSIAVTTSPKTNYTTCEKLVVNDWKVTATYSDASTSDVTSGCTFSPANGSDLTAGSQTVTVTHTASGKTTTETVTVTQGAKDTFVDNVQGTEDQYGDCNGYTIPSCGDKTKGTGCEGEHYKFIGWSSERIQTGVETEPSGLLKAGGTHDATGATYYAVWAAEEQ